MELIKPSIEYKESFIKGAKEFQALGDEKRFRRMNINIPEVEKDFDKYLEGWKYFRQHYFGLWD